MSDFPVQLNGKRSVAGDRINSLTQYGSSRKMNHMSFSFCLLHCTKSCKVLTLLAGCTVITLYAAKKMTSISLFSLPYLALLRARARECVCSVCVCSVCVCTLCVLCVLCVCVCSVCVCACVTRPLSVFIFLRLDASLSPLPPKTTTTFLLLLLRVLHGFSSKVQLVILT